MTSAKERLDESNTAAWAIGQANTELWMESHLRAYPTDWEWCGSPTLFFNESPHENKYYLVGAVRVFGLRYDFGWWARASIHDKVMALSRVTKKRPWFIPNQVALILDPLVFATDMARHPDRV